MWCVGVVVFDLVYVVCGRFDVFWEMGLLVWDMVVGVLMILEVGGLVGDLCGDEGYFDKGEIVCGMLKVFIGLFEVLC